MGQPTRHASPGNCVRRSPPPLSPAGEREFNSGHRTAALAPALLAKTRDAEAIAALEIAGAAATRAGAAHTVERRRARSSGAAHRRLTALARARAPGGAGVVDSAAGRAVGLSRASALARLADLRGSALGVVGAGARPADANAAARRRVLGNTAANGCWQAASPWQHEGEAQPSCGQSKGIALSARQPLNCGVHVH